MSANLLDVNFDYTYYGKLAKDVMYQPTVGTRPLGDSLTVRNAIDRYKEQYAIIPSLSDILRKYQSCGRSFTEGVTAENVTVELEQIELNLKWCKDNFESLLNGGNELADQYLRDGIEEFDPSGTQIQTIIDNIVTDGLRRSTNRIAYFADKTSISEKYDQLNGVWTRLIGSSGDNASYGVLKAASLGTGDLAAGAALDALTDCYDKSSIELKQLLKSKKYFEVTGSVYENLRKSYQSNTTGSENMFLNLVNGTGEQEEKLMFNGIPVIPRYDWDEALTDVDNPLYGTVKHLILYTYKENHILAVKDINAMTNISGFYDRTEREYIIEGFFRMGYNYIFDGMQTIAF